ncbi:MAG: DUF3300 domain-containing protein [Gammaproteobacteria bacterium]
MHAILRTLAMCSLGVSLACTSMLVNAAPPEAYPAVSVTPQDTSSYVPYSANQLDNLLAPIALYPDPLLAQVLPAATFVNQIQEAAQWVRTNGVSRISYQPWDVSVKAVAHYPSVLYMMNDKLNWTTALGQAYVNQSTDVMASIQRLRALARSAGNLVSNQQQQVSVEPGYIQIDPYQPQYIYVPVYDPYAVYYQGGYGYGQGFQENLISFGTGFIIGAWLNYDCDWRDDRIYYTDWRGDGWIARSRPYIQITNVYVNNRYAHIPINRAVLQRTVNVNNLNSYASVHRNVTFKKLVRARFPVNRNGQVSNRFINRNMRVQKLNQFHIAQNLLRTVPPHTAQPTFTPVQPYRTAFRSVSRPAYRPSSQPYRFTPHAARPVYRLAPQSFRFAPQAYRPAYRPTFQPAPQSYRSAPQSFQRSSRPYRPAPRRMRHPPLLR